MSLPAGLALALLACSTSETESDGPRAPRVVTAPRVAPVVAEAPNPAVPSDPGEGATAQDVGRTYYSFVDATGSIRMVDTLDAVPASARGRAKRIDVAPAAPRREATDGPAQSPVVRAAAGSGVSPATSRGSGEAAVVIYTAKWCGWCRAALAHLDERGVSYTNRDIDDDPDAPRDLRRLTGSTAIPVLDIEGDIVRGFDVARIDALLDRR